MLCVLWWSAVCDGTLLHFSILLLTHSLYLSHALLLGVFKKFPYPRLLCTEVSPSELAAVSAPKNGPGE